MTSEEWARLCFAARPVLWALAIIAVLLVAAVLSPPFQIRIPIEATIQVPDGFRLDMRCQCFPDFQTERVNKVSLPI